MGLSLARVFVWMKSFGSADYDVLSLLTPVRRLLPLRQIYLIPYNTSGTTLFQAPTLQKLLLLLGFLAPTQVPVASVAFCTIGATCALLHLGRH